MELARACGADAALVPASETAGAARFLFRNGRILPVPAGPGLLASKILPLMDRIRLLKEPFIKPSQAEHGEESLARFCDRRLGKMARLKLLTPVVSGIYAGDPERLGAESAFPAMVKMEREYGSLLRAAMKGGGPPSRGRLQTFRFGLQDLALKIVQSLDGGLHSGQRASAVERRGENWHVTTEQGSTFEADHLVLAMTAADIARLVGEIDQNLAEELDAIHYSKMSVVHLGVRQEHTGDMPDGFGFLVPRDEGLRILGSIFSSRLFAGRAPAGHELVTIFMGGDLDPGALDLDDETLVDIAVKDMRKALGGEWKPEISSVTRWPLGVPQYEVGHKDRISRINQMSSRHQGLYLLGNWKGGIAMPDCVREGAQVSECILASMQPEATKA